MILTGTLDEDATFNNITVEGDLDVSGLDSNEYSFNGVTVEGNTII